MASPPRPYSIDAACASHILVGNAKGGGHRHGAGWGKSEFPSGWSDAEILTRIEEVANDAASISTSARLGRLRIIGTRNGVKITVIADPGNWAVITGYPT